MRSPFKPTTIPQILVVDDTPDNLFLIREILEGEGYQLHFASNGRQALDMVALAPPDLILLDIMMPEMDGYEVTLQIRQNSEIPFIPILLLTAYDQADLVQGLDTGADDFVRKPVDPDELMARVRSLLRFKFLFSECEKLSLQREEFIAHLTHDLRTPLVAADMMYRLFQKEAFCPLSIEMHEAVTALSQSNQNLLELVNTLLQVSCYDAGGKNLAFVTCDICEITQHVIQEVQPLAAAKTLDLTIQTLTPNLENFLVLGDCQEIHRMLTNLVANAIKFTDTGGVEVQLGYETADLDQNQLATGWVIIKVQDSGFGISEADQATIFKRFQKGRHQQAGSGLGLHLVHHIVTVHQGTVSVNSELGRGTTFTVRLPACLPKQ
jgi:signal transduction histidine kinase